MRRTLRFLLLATLFPASAVAAVRLEIDNLDAEPGDRISVVVNIAVDGRENTAAITNDLSFDPSVLQPVIEPEHGTPSCSLEDDVTAFLKAFSFEPRDCDPAAGHCNAVKALAALLDLGPPPVTRRGLYHCQFDVARQARPGRYRVAIGNASYSTPSGAEGAVRVSAGFVNVGPASFPTDTPLAATPTPRPTLSVLSPECTGDCNASGSVDEGEEAGLLHAVFAPEVLSSCDGWSAEADATTTAAHIIAAVRARFDGCLVATPTQSPRPSTTPDASLTPTIEAELTPTLTAEATPVETEPAAATATPRPRTPTITPIPTRTRKPTVTPTRTRASTPTPTPTSTRPRPTMTATPGDGPRITALGIARADGRMATPVGESDGLRVFEAVTGVGFKIVAEGAPAPSLIPVGTTTFVADASSAPDFQAVVSQDLGNGNRRVCNGGVPAVEPPDFAADADILAALSDLGCHFSTGQCLSYSDGSSHYFSPQSTVQFCAVVGNQFRFGRGDTRITVRLLDRDGTPGEAAAIIVRVPG